MKNFLKYLFGILCLLTIGVAQAQFNYVGLIKDANGNPVSSQNLSMRISILDESQNIDYQESHTVSSSADGIVDLVIGNGTVISGLFSELDWSRTFYLKDEVDFGNGYVTMGIEAIKPVPLASYALNSNRNLVDENDNLLVNNDHNTSTDESNNTNLHNTKNVGLGPHALESNTTGWYNVAVGWNALKENTEGHDNVAFGPRTLQQNTTGAYNAALGYNSLRNNTTGGSNTALGAGALVMNTEGNDNVGVGYAAMYNNATGDSNVALGNHALNDNTSGSKNTAIGQNAMIENTTGGLNTALGQRALENNTTGDRNTAIGHHASGYMQTGSFNTTLGIAAGRDAIAADGVVALGYHAMYTQSNSANITGAPGNTAVGYFAMAGSETSSNTSEQNTAVGFRTQENSSSGSQNTSLGYESLKNNTSGNGNVAIGHHALLEMDGTGSTSFSNNYSHSASTENTAIGKAAMGDNTEGSFNTAVGAYALQNNGTGFNNTALGLWTLNRNNNGVGNTAIGWGALINTENGGGNVAVGTHTGQYLANNSNNNTFLGDNSGTTETNSSTSIFNATAVGSQAKVTESNAMSFGDSNVTKWAFGLNTTDSGKVIQVGSNSGNGNGAYLTAGGVWTDASSILFKTNFIDLDNDWIKRQIAKLKIRRWDYKETDETHIGPTAEEFIDLFSVGIETDKQHLSTLDVAGVALKGVQAVIQENQELKEENAALEQQYQDLKELLTQVLQRVEKLEQQ